MHARLRETVAGLDEVQELPASAGALYAASRIIGATCDDDSLAFMRCKAADANPIACVAQGKAVTRCAVSVLRQIHDGPCAGAFRTYVAALEKRNLEFKSCRAEEHLFMSCWNKAD